MKIKMLTTEYDNETNTLIWNKDDIFTIDMENSYPPEYYIFTSFMGMPYGASCDCEGVKFEVIEG